MGFSVIPLMVHIRELQEHNERRRASEKNNECFIFRYYYKFDWTEIASYRCLIFGFDVKLKLVHGICRRNHIFACSLLDIETGILGNVSPFLSNRLALNKCIWLTRL